MCGSPFVLYDAEIGTEPENGGNGENTVEGMGNGDGYRESVRSSAPWAACSPVVSSSRSWLLGAGGVTADPDCTQLRGAPPWGCRRQQCVLLLGRGEGGFPSYSLKIDR
jgi:hypothetical protein